MVEIITNTFKIQRKFFQPLLRKIQSELKLKGKMVIKLGDETESHQLNLEFLKRDYPTDVISFPMQEKLPGGFYIGDIHICYPVAQKQAQENQIPVEKELFILMVHGILHLANYDHETDSGEMLALQDRLVSQYFPAETSS